MTISIRDNVSTGIEENVEVGIYAVYNGASGWSMHLSMLVLVSVLTSFGSRGGHVDDVENKRLEGRQGHRRRET